MKLQQQHIIGMWFNNEFVYKPAKIRSLFIISD